MGFKYNKGHDIWDFSNDWHGGEIQEYRNRRTKMTTEFTSQKQMDDFSKKTGAIFKS